MQRTSTPTSYIVMFGTVMVGLFAYLTFRIMGDNPMWIDTYIREVLVRPDSSSIYTFFRYFTKSGSAIGVVILLVLSVLFFYMRDKDFKAMILLPIAVLMTHFLNDGVKALTQRDRPAINPIIDAVGYSFPSGHAMISMVAYGLAAYLIVCKLRSDVAKCIVTCVAIVFIFLNGLSRIILSAHYPTDVIAGYIFGGCILYGCIYVYNTLGNREGMRG
ncbi:phosphatase PAP2 family protein [Priestia taiwanensis]|uniref:Phosphatidylglycerophosphatase B n=1 Tax=Priestia taiwanensis TaxID=1347902 RepID=A0A917ASR6_9BACI|nr:phosphatase PAP2 family protein [Priestia taiwanensis]MBM7364063.1 undecaprenyl-diphosphatase [Priestia taiwanensis]GGE71317.1 phosphatidylglycerophosphatase B [Priestia taiwanensis]